MIAPATGLSCRNPATARSKAALNQRYCIQAKVLPMSVTPTTRRISPEMIIAAGCLMSLLTFGPRSSLGAFQRDMLDANHWSREVFSIGIALQNLFWGVGQPFAGAVADRFGAVRVICVGAVLYALGLASMAYTADATAYGLTSGLLIGFGLSGCSFNLVLAAFTKLLPDSRRNMALGMGTAAGSLGQFLFNPLAVGLIGDIGWQNTFLVFAATTLCVIPLSLALATPTDARVAGAGAPQSIVGALREAFGHRSYVLLVLGFFTCGFQLAYITAHLQIYLTDKGLLPWVGGTALALIGLFNIVGSLSAGWLSSRMPKRYILSGIYLARAAVTLLFLALPVSTSSVFIYAAVSGLLWLSTVPPTSALVNLMFGARHMAMLYGFAFFSHQVGGFLGVWLGGRIFDQTGSYVMVWYISIALGIASALINLPIVEKPVLRAPVTA